MNSKELEKYSSAVTLSDMEIFVFPELMYSLLLANIMSPIIWRWRDEDCFVKLAGKSKYKKLMRLKQFIMDNYEFNLDLETWGLTDKDAELGRFSDVLAASEIEKSNALFGYHGDEYYFDVDIRKHFGLDKYNTDIIPYWKTETVEAMSAFAYKENYRVGAGECVSLAALYAAAAFVVCEIPLDDIYMILTPLHSQNFIDIEDGVLTNNRRIVTKSMWFNGTTITDKAQRALRNEQVTIVSHRSGYVHCVYEDATIEKQSYEKMRGSLNGYLAANLDMQSFASFLRVHSEYQKYFQICRDCHGSASFLPAELLFRYEHGSEYRIAEGTHNKLLAEVSDEDFLSYEIADRVRCDEMEKFFAKYKPDLRRGKDRELMEKFFGQTLSNSAEVVDKLVDYLYLEARLPGGDKRFVDGQSIDISVDMSREEIIEYLGSIRGKNETADLAFYAYRDMNSCEWEPFVKAAIERNPVSIEMFRGKSVDQVCEYLRGLGDESIYDGGRLSQPDEVVNYGRGDGVEKAFVLANVIRSQNGDGEISLLVSGKKVQLGYVGKIYEFSSGKGLEKKLGI